MAKANRKQIVWSDSMYNHNDHYLKFCILRSIGLTIQTICRLDFLQLSTSEVLWWKHYYRQKRLLSFQNEQLFVFNDKQSTQYHKKHSSLINEMFWTRWLCEWRRGENRWQIGSACFFKTNLKLINRCKLVFTQMMFDSRLQFVWPMEYSI